MKANIVSFIELMANPFFDQDKVDELITLVDQINEHLYDVPIWVSVNDDDDSTLDVFFNGKTIFNNANIDNIISWLHGIKLVMDHKAFFLSSEKSYVYIVQQNDTTDEEGTNSDVLGVFYDEEKAQALLAEKKKEIAKMYKDKIPNPDNNVIVGCDKPCRYHIYDEYSDNDTEIFIEKQEIK